MVEVLSFVLRGSSLGLHRTGVGDGKDNVLCPSGSQWLGSVERRAVEVVVESVVWMLIVGGNKEVFGDPELR